MDDTHFSVFENRLHKTDSCWLFLGALNSRGYATVSVQKDRKRKGYLLHRVFYERYVGPIPKDLVIDHLCRARNCVNPSHLEAVTNTENMLRGVGAPSQNAKKTHCKHGHEFNEKNTRIKKRRDGTILGRECRPCLNNGMKLYYYRKKKNLRLSNEV